jgi:hypothetical protein
MIKNWKFRLISFLSLLIGMLCGLHLHDVVLNLRDVGLVLHDVIGIPPDVFDFMMARRVGHNRCKLRTPSRCYGKGRLETANEKAVIFASCLSVI